jgi:hypothetical protein
LLDLWYVLAGLVGGNACLNEKLKALPNLVQVYAVTFRDVAPYKIVLNRNLVADIAFNV